MWGGAPTTSYFYQVANSQTKFGRYQDSDGVLVGYTFNAAEENQIYQRKYPQIVDIVSKIGGVYTALFTIGKVFTGIFAYKLMMSSLIGQMFYFKPRFKEELEKKKNKKGKKGNKKDKKGEKAEPPPKKITTSILDDALEAKDPL